MGNIINQPEVILFSVAFGYVFGEVSRIPQSFARWLMKFGFYRTMRINPFEITKQPYSLKPFTCGLCLSFWTCLTLSILIGTGFPSIGYAFAASLFTVLIKAIHERIIR